MSRLVLEIARWEFWRWFKWKSTVLTLILATLAGLLFSLASSFFGDDASSAPLDETASVWPIPVVHPERMGVREVETGSFRLMPFPGDDASRLLQQMAAGELSALLLLHSREEAELQISPLLPEFEHGDELRALLEALRYQQALRERGADEAELSALAAGVRLEQHVATLGPGLEEEPEEEGEGSTLVAVVVNLLMLLGVYVGLSMQFFAITGEKQQRVTEQVLACVGAQCWMDGKILGLALLSVTTTLTYALGFLLFAGVAHGLTGWGEIPALTVAPGMLGTMVALCLGGFLLWVSFFAGVAATVNDPNTSAKGGLMVLPMVPFLLALVALQNPDSGWLRILSWFPPTAPPLMTTRLLLGEVAGWEIGLALALMVAATLLLRRAAGRVFGLAILLQGNEPGWREILGWFRRS